MSKKEFYCQLCDFTTLKPSHWLTHTKTQKHLRNGAKKTHNCKECDYVASTPWNLRMHFLTKHATKEERQKQKYYCPDCDLVFFSPLFYDSHMKGIRHKNYVDSMLELEKIKNIKSDNNYDPKIIK